MEYSYSYRFRVIRAATLYPFRVYVQGHPQLNVRASDGFEIVQGNESGSKDLLVKSFIIHPGERYDFTLNANNRNQNTYLLVAESIEDLSSKNTPEYHAAEAIIQYKGTPLTYPEKDSNDQSHCTVQSPCVTFNCPYLFYPKSANRVCITFDEAKSNESLSNFNEVLKVDETLFFNFAFPGESGNTPGSVNGRQFIHPISPILTNEADLRSQCTESNCREDKICSCTYTVELSFHKVYQFVISNLGNGRGWSHPIHLHGHYFFVVKMGFGSYNEDTGKLLTSTT